MDRLLYEVIPPPKNWSEEKIDVWTKEICALMKEQSVNCVNLPEVINETRDEERVIPFLEKVDNLGFATRVKTACPSFKPIPNKICVRMEERALLEWVNSCDRAGIKQMILVGGEHSSIRYPGPSVTKSAKMIKAEFPYIKLGGITIFTRKGEAKRILAKMQSGIDFFVSQIIFETSNVKCALLDLEHLLAFHGMKMPSIYLSLAPATTKKDIAFMQWLGVEFPTAVLSYFQEAKEDEIQQRVFDVLDFQLDELAHFISKKQLDIGFNVEQIMYQGIDSGKRLLTLVKRKLCRCL